MKTNNVNEGRRGFAVTPEKYQPICEAILASLSRTGPGVTFNELVASVARQVSADKFPKQGSISWYTKVVQLDLEAKGELERVPGQTPLRIRRTNGKRTHSRIVLHGES
jgi:hypothetical protein